MAETSLIIVGAGIGGLSAGCYARLSKLNTRIFEMHAIPGGMCTAWKRKGFTFEGSIHHLAGCRPGGPLYAMWEELGAMPREVLLPDDLTQVEDPEGNRFTVYTDLDRLEAHMLDSFPEDATMIRRYVRAARRLIPHDLLELPLTGYRGLLGKTRVLPTLVHWGRPTMRSIAEDFKSDFLRRAFPTIQYNWPDIPVVVHLNMLAQCAVGNYGFPTGGSLPFVQSIETRFRELGGEITYGARVTEILTENGRATGVRLEDGTEHRADAVISNVFERTTIERLLGGRYVDDRLRSRFASEDSEVVMGIHVSIGVERDLSDEPHALVLFLERPIEIADRTLDRIPVELYGFDPTLAPAGTGVIKVLLNTSYDLWERLSHDRARYDAAKTEIADRVIAAIEPRFPHLSAQIEVVDVATPMTTNRYTGQGRPYGTQEGIGLDLLFSRPRTLRSLGAFYWIGQSAGGGGIPGCAAMGRSAVRALCRELHVPFGGRRI